MRQNEFAEKSADDLSASTRTLVWTVGVALLVAGFIAACREDSDRGEFPDEDSKAA